jgi:hypothetical protein
VQQIKADARASLRPWMRGQQARACAGAPTDSYRLSAMAHPSRPFTHTTQPLRIVQCRRAIGNSAANRREAVVMFEKPHAKRQAQQITADVRASLRPWMRRQQARACAGAPTGSYRVSAMATHHDRSANSTQTKPLRSVHSPRAIATSAANRRPVFMFENPHARRQAQQIKADVLADLRPWIRRRQARA